jgi:hypothetical protein
MMNTTLPTLPYNPTGFLCSENFHSSKYTKERAPRTDLKHLVPWNTFKEDIDEAITARMSIMNIPLGTECEIELRIGGENDHIVMNEEGVRQQANLQLHLVVNRVLRMLGVNGMFFPPNSGNNQIIGEPDFFWSPDLAKYPKIVVRVLVSMISAFDRPHLCGTAGVQDKMGMPS